MMLAALGGAARVEPTHSGRPSSLRDDIGAAELEAQSLVVRDLQAQPMGAGPQAVGSNRGVAVVQRRRVSGVGVHGGSIRTAACYVQLVRRTKRRRKLTQEKADAINRRRDMLEGTERSFEVDALRVVLDQTGRASIVDAARGPWPALARS